MWVKESITAFFPVPPAHHRVTRCDIAREKLLGLIGDLLDVSLAQEESIVPEYQTSRSFENCSFVSYLIIYTLELFSFCLIYLGIDYRTMGQHSADLTIFYDKSGENVTKTHLYKNLYQKVFPY